MCASIFLSSRYFTVCGCLLSSIILDTRPPHLDQWQQRAWYDLGATQEVLHQMRIRLSRGLPAIASPPRAESPSPSRRPAASPIRPIHEGEFVKASKGGSSAPQHCEHWAILACSEYFSRTEKKKRRKHKPAKCTVTSETVSLPEKKKKVISESPDSQAEGPFCNSDTVSAPEDSSHAI